MSEDPEGTDPDGAGAEMTDDELDLAIHLFAMNYSLVTGGVLSPTEAEQYALEGARKTAMAGENPFKTISAGFAGLANYIAGLIDIDDLDPVMILPMVSSYVGLVGLVAEREHRARRQPQHPGRAVA